jgi:hypothetical protein
VTHSVSNTVSKRMSSGTTARTREVQAL